VVQTARPFTPPKDIIKTYSGPTVVVTAAIAWMSFLASSRREPVPPDALLGPMIAMFWLTALVWLVMVLARNIAVVRGAASIQYYTDYHSDVPDERIERPARAFNNLMQLPTLFYVVCLLMFVTKRADAAQVTIAWTFVAFRLLHAAVYVLFNHVPYRFAFWMGGFLALCFLWFRFGALAP